MSEDRLTAFAELIRRWSPRLDLVSPRDLDRLETRHLADSLRLLPLLDELPPGPCADVGSGGGFPGIPLALMRPERHWRLIEPAARRAAFLEEAIRHLDLDSEVLVMRVEEAARRPDLAGRHALVTARALAPPNEAFRLIRPLAAPDGVAAVFLGADAEVPERAERWGERPAAEGPGEEASGGLAIIRGDHHRAAKEPPPR